MRWFKSIVAVAGLLGLMFGGLWLVEYFDMTYYLLQGLLIAVMIAGFVMAVICVYELIGPEGV